MGLGISVLCKVDFQIGGWKDRLESSLGQGQQWVLVGGSADHVSDGHLTPQEIGHKSRAMVSAWWQCSPAKVPSLSLAVKGGYW